MRRSIRTTSRKGDEPENNSPSPARTNLPARDAVRGPAPLARLERSLGTCARAKQEARQLAPGGDCGRSRRRGRARSRSRKARSRITMSIQSEEAPFESFEAAPSPSVEPGESGPRAQVPGRRGVPGVRPLARSRGTPPGPACGPSGARPRHSPRRPKAPARSAMRNSFAKANDRHRARRSLPRAFASVVRGALVETRRRARGAGARWQSPSARGGRAFSQSALRQ